jgi:hypothetical protein
MSIRISLRRKTVFGLLAAAWSLVILAVFLERTADMCRPLAAFLTRSALAALSAYAYLFTGFRIRRGLSRLFPRSVDPLEATLIDLGLGAGAFIAALVVGGVLGLYGRPFAWVLLGVALVGNHPAFLAEARTRAGALRPGPGGALLLTLLVLAGGMAFFHGFAPPTCQDALVYHLAVPARYVEEGGFVKVPGNFYAHFPANVEMLFTFGLLLDGGGLAQWHHWLFGVAAAASVGALARALSPRGGGLLAAAVFATAPTAMLIAGWAYVDLAVVYFASLSTLAFLRWTEGGSRVARPRRRLAGLAAGTKYTGGLQGILVASRSSSWASAATARRVLRGAGCAAAVVGVLASPGGSRTSSRPRIPSTRSV